MRITTGDPLQKMDHLMISMAFGMEPWERHAIVHHVFLKLQYVIIIFRQSLEMFP